jgi:hypothetical protein
MNHIAQRFAAAVRRLNGCRRGPSSWVVFDIESGELVAENLGARDADELCRQLNRAGAEPAAADC